MGAVTHTILQLASWLILFSWQPAVPASAAQKQMKSPHGQLNVACENCHTATAWKPIRAVPEFDHNKTRYPLRGMHEKVQCVQCHVKPVFTDVGRQCQDCHTDIHNRQMGTNCAECHTVQGWNIAVQQVKDHQNRFPLLGAHAAVQCEDCHKGAAVGQFLGLSTACISCHLTDYQKTTNPNHVSSNFPQTCETCHTFDSWLGAVFDHNTTGFPLQNSHQMAPAGKVNACTDCHISNNYNLKIGPTDCGNAQCHLTTNYGGGWMGTNNPTHSTAGPTFAAANCSTCHNTISFLTATFDHSTTGFPLQNSHQMAPAGKVNACTDCHINNNYTLTIGPTDCGNALCHLTTNYGGGWQGTTTPVHSTAGAPFAAANCSTCHNTISFLTATFDHSVTGFPLQNSHQLVPAGKVNACTDCHINNNYTLTIGPTDCGNAQCHLSNFYGGGWQGTTTPVHSTAGAPFAAANCSTCHNTISFLTATFDHSTTGFPLTNSHQMAPAGKVNACTDCHINNNYTLTIQPTDCGNAQCHLATWNTTPSFGGSVPNHITAGFPIAQCSTCHDTITWLDSTFNHAGPPANFPLTNSHQVSPAGKVASCDQCHNGNYSTLTVQPTDCGNAQCHLSNFYGGGWQGTTNPVHSTAGAPFAAANCSTCHNTISFLTATFDHSTTGFPLTNSHQMAPAGKVNACADCHISNNYTLTIQPTDCGNAQCHLATWNTTPSFGGTVPNHITAGFPIAQCSTCHDTITWLDSTFNHATTGFTLTNSHQLVANGGKVTSCDQCHVGNYSTLTVQPTDCGNAQCHLNQFYGGGWQGTNNPVHSTAGAPFAAANCSTCHNTISFLTATFDHSTTGFPLTNSHQLAPAGKVNACTDCHISNNYTLTILPTDCGNAQCHLTTNYGGGWQGTTNPSHAAAGGAFPVAVCSTCHNTISFLTATFDHSTTGFPLTNSHQLAPAGKVNACTDCHINGNYTLTILPTDCGNSQCHLSTNYGGGWQGTTSPVHSSAGAPFAAANCSTCHSTISFLTATFDHSVTGWPLTGSHQLAPAGKVVSCTDAFCHVGNNYTLTTANTDCMSCHTAAWNTTITLGGNVPNHVAANFPTSMCSTCHDTIAWVDGKFDHTTTGFPLTGPHMLPPRTAVTGAIGTMVNTCTDCHIGGNYTTGYPAMDCYSCHTTYYTNAQTYGTSVPNHITANYPTACVSCHTTWATTAWLGAVFTHAAFKQPHHSSVCADCHIVPTNYLTFSCIVCHSGSHSNKASVDSTHNGKSGYTYNATICVNCHKS